MAEQKRVSRKWLYAAWIGAALIVAIYYGVWRFAAGEMQKGVHKWVEDQRAAGLQVEHGSVRRDGFPFFLRVHVDTPKISSPDVFHWSADRLSLDALPYDLNRLILSPSGAQTFSSTEIGEWRYSADSIRASIANDEARGWAFAMNVEKGVASRSDGVSAKLGRLVYDLAPEVEDNSTLTLSLVSDDLAVSGADNEIAVSRFETALSLTQSPFLNSGAPLEDWRRQGGALKIHGMNAVINKAELSVAGEISLDADFRPAGVLNAILAKPAGLADILSASGALTREEADATAAGLGLAAMAQGGKIIAPIELTQGGAFIDGRKVAELPSLNQ